MKKVLALVFLFLPILVLSQESDIHRVTTGLDKGMELLDDGIYSEAETVFREILESDDNRHGAVVGLGRAVMYQGRLEEAYQIFNEAVEAFNTSDAWFFRGFTAFKLGRIEQSRNDYMEAIDLGYDHFDAYFNIGHTYYTEGKFSEGEEWFRKALEKNGDFASSWYYMGICKYKQGVDAWYEFSKTIELDPSYLMAYVYRGALLDKIKEYQKAAENYRKAVELNPDYAWGYFYLGRDLKRIGQSAEAVENLDKAVSLGLINEQVYDAMAGSFWDLKKYDKAEEYFNKAVQQAPDSAWVYNNRGYFYKQNWHSKNYEMAIEDFKMAIQLDPEWAPPYNYLGFVYNALGRYGEAIEVLMEAVRLAPDWSWPWNNLGSAQSQMGRKEEAIMSYHKSMECDPGYVYPHYNLGILYQNEKEYEKAIESYRMALKLNPRHSDSYNNLGNVFVSLGQYKEAAENFTKGLEIEPDHILLLRNRGKCYYNLDQPEKAIVDLNRVLELQPDSAFSHKYLGLSYVDLVELNDAKLHLEKAVELSPSYSEELRGVLGKLKVLDDYLQVYLIWDDTPIEGLNVTFIGLPEYDTEYTSDSFGSVLIPRNKLKEGKKYYLYGNGNKDWEFSFAVFNYHEDLNKVQLQIMKKLSGIDPADAALISNVSPVLQWEHPEGVEWFKLSISRKTKELENGIKGYTEFRKLDRILDTRYHLREELLPNEYLWEVTAFSGGDKPLYYLSRSFTIE